MEKEIYKEAARLSRVAEDSTDYGEENEADDKKEKKKIYFGYRGNEGSVKRQGEIYKKGYAKSARDEMTVERKKKIWKTPDKHSMNVMVLLFGAVLTVIIFSASLSAGGIIIPVLEGSALEYSADTETLASCENAYVSLEKELVRRMAEYERNHNYDAYEYMSDGVGHDGDELFALLSVMNPEGFTSESVMSDLKKIADFQYSFDEKITEEIRWREVTMDVPYVVTFPDGSISVEMRSETRSVPYVYRKATVSLKNHGTDYAARKILNSEEYELYLIYLEAHRDAQTGGKAEK